MTDTKVDRVVFMKKFQQLIHITRAVVSCVSLVLILSTCSSEETPVKPLTDNTQSPILTPSTPQSPSGPSTQDVAPSSDGDEGELAPASSKGPARFTISTTVVEPDEMAHLAQEVMSNLGTYLSQFPATGSLRQATVTHIQGYAKSPSFEGSLIEDFDNRSVAYGTTDPDVRVFYMFFPRDVFVDPSGAFYFTRFFTRQRLSLNPDMTFSPVNDVYLTPIYFNSAQVLSRTFSHPFYSARSNATAFNVNLSAIYTNFSEYDMGFKLTDNALVFESRLIIQREGETATIYVRAFYSSGPGTALDPGEKGVIGSGSFDPFVRIK